MSYSVIQGCSLSLHAKVSCRMKFFIIASVKSNSYLLMARSDKFPSSERVNNRSFLLPYLELNFFVYSLISPMANFINLGISVHC